MDPGPERTAEQQPGLVQAKLMILLPLKRKNKQHLGPCNKNNRSNRGLLITTETRLRAASSPPPTVTPSELSLLFLLLLGLSAEPQLPKSRVAPG